MLPYLVETLASSVRKEFLINATASFLLLIVFNKFKFPEKNKSKSMELYKRNIKKKLLQYDFT